MTRALEQLIAKKIAEWREEGARLKHPQDYPAKAMLFQCADELEAALALPGEPEKQMADAAEMLWVVLANVSGGDWTKQSPEWQEAAARWRDNYFAALTALPGGRESKEEKA